MNKRWIALLGIALLAVLGLGIWGNQQNTSKKLLQTALGNNYLRAFYSASYHVQNTEVLLGKSLVASGPDQYGQLFQEIRVQSNQALDNLSQLPVDDAILGRTVKFMSQLGDYAQTLTDQVNRGKTVNQDQWTTLNRLYNQSSDLNAELGQIHADIIDGKLNFYELATAGSSRLGREGKKLAGASFQKIDQEMHGYPTLIYDGPFSDHMEQGQARGITGVMINKEKARSTALKFYDNITGGNVLARVTGAVEGNIPAYRVELSLAGGAKAKEPTVADVSQKGGHLIWFLLPRAVTSADYGLDKATARAGAYLKEHGYQDMQLNYYQRNQNTVTFNYVFTQQGVKIYPDLVKVTVALDNGQVVGLDARSYLMSHHRRQIPRPKLTEKQARDLVSDKLQLQGNGKLALIPLNVDQEKLTWEFKGQLGSDVYLVYVNALDGKEENLLRLIQTKDGTLTM